MILRSIVVKPIDMEATQVRILIEGYAKEIKGGWLASSTTVLVDDKGIKTIIDPGCNKNLLLKKMRKENVSLEGVDYVFVTHYHYDHNFLMAIFPRAKILDDELIYDNDKQTNHEGKIPGTGIQIISTPGHEKLHGSLIVPTNNGIVAIVGDVFWWADEEKEEVSTRSKLLNHSDPFVKDLAALRKSRVKILSTADYIVPGHGKMFKNPTK